MRGLLDLSLLLLVIAVPLIVVAAILRRGQQPTLTGRRRRAALDRARWRAESRVEDDRTVVVVCKSIPAGSGHEQLGEMVVAEVPAADPEWDIKVSQAMLDARVRADILNQEQTALG